MLTLSDSGFTCHQPYMVCTLQGWASGQRSKETKTIASGSLRGLLLSSGQYVYMWPLDQCICHVSCPGGRVRHIKAWVVYTVLPYYWVTQLWNYLLSLFWGWSLLGEAIFNFKLDSKWNGVSFIMMGKLKTF